MRSGRSLKFYLRLIRHSGTPESVGRGIAVGLFSAFVLPGGHMLMAFLLAVLVRGARGASVLITWVTNPLTMPLIWPAQCYLGNYLLGMPLSQSRIKLLLQDVIHEPSWRTIGTLSSDLLFSFFAGGLVFGSIAAVIGYFCSIALVRRYRIRRAGRKAFRINRFKPKENIE